jgi:hypothetical protein
MPSYHVFTSPLESPGYVFRRLEQVSAADAVEAMEEVALRYGFDETKTLHAVDNAALDRRNPTPANRGRTRA